MEFMLVMRVRRSFEEQSRWLVLIRVREGRDVEWILVGFLDGDFFSKF
jgi:hypothetical protein